MIGKIFRIGPVIMTLTLIYILHFQVAGAKELSVKEIVDRANRVSYYQGADGRAKVSMIIKDSQGRERMRQFTILRKDIQPSSGDTNDQHTGDQRYYVFFHRPADVNKMAFLVWKYLDKDDDRWLYLPALDLVKRIASREKRTSFVGSHFLYEDVSGRNIDADNHELLKTSKNYYVLKSTTKEPGLANFSYFTTWIHRETFLPIKTEYHNEKGEKYRIYEALKVDRIKEYPTVIKSRMKDTRMGGETLLQYSDVRYDINLPEKIFTERYLRRAPKQFLR